ncbi:SAM-dependent methyltransferase [Oecophyllibacter saccharovorans]|uniref:Class I SAM-dependent methyltransferase n=1 Tax=Oecophyllibacter saccharovorans TaxID=2558360 RepID=A0A506US30_9PROT|nr:cyclopropane-fatty-acyl-phospholipid synthase family protein [Oecophyllibacter saccharovorans]TPW35893.1 class I SAM-dependent methyltransferase [Oecophyllibacter saccharovorans]
MNRLLDIMFRGFIQKGNLHVTYSDGSQRSYRGKQPGESAGLRFYTSQAERALLFNPGLRFGEAYMDEGLGPEGCSLEQLMRVLMTNIEEHSLFSEEVSRRLRYAGRLLRPLNSLGRARTNVAHHYDLDQRLYRLFLDEDMQYSCGYFESDDVSLEEAQLAKKHHIAQKLKLDRPGLEVLDIGCGWGGMALTLARDYGARVLGVTLSVEQLEVARQRAREAGLEDQVTFELLDYRTLHRKFDRIVSVGMFEHVGLRDYATFFRRVHDLLRDDGVALIHSIGRMDGPGTTNPWIAKYIFPGGYSPALSETLAAVEQSGLWVADCEVLRLHYAKTLAHWRKRFEEHRAEIVQLYDERFVRMFEFYLLCSELAFRLQGHMNFQLQLTRSIEAVPLTRDYLLQAA